MVQQLNYIPRLFFLMFLFIVATGTDQAFGQDPVYWQITDDDGLPSMTVYNITQDTLGFMWIGTANGLVRYDGIQLKNYYHESQKDNEIVTVRRDCHGRIWYSNLSNQIYYIEANQIYPFRLIDSNGEFKITSYDCSEEGMLFNCIQEQIPDSTFIYYLPCDQDLHQIKLKKENIVSKGAKEKIPIAEVAPNKLAYNFGEIYSRIKLYHYEDSTKQQGLIRSMEVLRPYVEYFSPYRIHDQKLFSFGYTFHWVDFNDKKYSKVDFPYKINELFFLGNEIWMPTKGGLGVYKIEKGDLKEITTYYKGLEINTLFIDHEANIWLGTNEKGLLIIPSLKFITPAGLNENQPVYSILNNDQKNLVYAGQKQGRVSVIDGNSASVIREIMLPKVNGSVTKLVYHDNLFIGTDNSLFYSKKNKPGKFIALNNGGAIKDFIIDNEDNLWICNDHCTEMTPLDSIETQDFRNRKNIISERSNAIAEDSKGRKWIGTPSGLFLYENDTITQFSSEDGPFIYSVSKIIESKDSSIWVGTFNHGVYQIKNEQIISTFNAANGFAFNTCNDLIEDHAQNLWIATRKGLFNYKISQNKWFAYSILDGLPSDEVLSIRVTNQMAWVGTAKGMVCFPIDFSGNNQVPPKIHITRFSIMGRDTSILKNYDLKHDQNTIRISFAGLGIRARKQIKYIYQLEGLSGDWLEAPGNYVFYAGLPPGNYSFSVKAINEDNIQSKTPATLQFTIHPPWWSTWWSRTIAFMLVIGLIWLYFFLRFKNKQRQEEMNREFQKKLDELSMQALQTQMNPHFIFNSLNAIQHFLTINDKENALMYLAKFSRLIRMVFNQSTQKSILLEEELEFLRTYLSLEDLRFNHEVEIELKVAPAVDQHFEEWFVPPLLIQPIIENAFKHGLFHKKGEKKLKIEFKVVDEMLQCVVIDNGIGISESQKINQWKKKDHKSAGISTTRERLSMLHNENPKFNSDHPFLKIIDLTDNGVPAGTRVEIFL